MKMLSVWLGAYCLAYTRTDAATPFDYHTAAAQTFRPVKHSKAAPWTTKEAAAEAAAHSECGAQLRTSTWADLFENGAAEPTPHLVSRPKF
jgi:hypothetical protein